MLSKFLILFFIFSSEAAVFASESGAFTGILVQAGNGSVSGDLADDSSIQVRGTEVIFGSEDKSESKLRGLFSTPFTNVTLNGATGRFPFAKEQLHVFRAGIIPNICYEMIWSISGCLGIGFQNIEVADESGDNRQMYGTIGGQARLGKFFGKGIIGGIVIDYFELEEKRNGVQSRTTFLPVAATIGYSLHLGGEVDGKS